MALGPATVKTTTRRLKGSVSEASSRFQDMYLIPFSYVEQAIFRSGTNTSHRDYLYRMCHIRKQFCPTLAKGNE